MTRKTLDGMTKEQLLEREKQLSSECEQLKKVIEASNTTVFDLLIGEIKKEMEDNIAEEEWKKLKENQKKIENFRSIEKTLQNQEDLLERKEEELEDVINAIENYQMTIFDQQAEMDGQIIETEYKDNQQQHLRTGDIYKSNQENVTCGYWYYLIKKSAEKEGSFAIISNFFEGERLLQYPKNLELLDYTHYEGNIYLQDDDQEKALEGLKVIADSIKTDTKETEAIVAGDGGVFDENGKEPKRENEEEEG